MKITSFSYCCKVQIRGIIFLTRKLRFRQCTFRSLNHKHFSMQSSGASIKCNLEKSNVISAPKSSVISSYAGRHYSTEELRKIYEEGKLLWEKKKLPEDISVSAVFASNELDLRDTQVYGFDYDYTIAQYEQSVEYLIYDLGKKLLVSKYRYPKEIENLQYNPSYAVRGLHYDIQNGLLMKLDQFQQIQVGSIYRGLTRVPWEEVRSIYGSRALSLGYVEGHLKGKTKMAHLADLFSIPEMCLLRQVSQFFMDNDLPYHSISLFNDVKSAIGNIHPEMHRIVGQDVAKYLIKHPKLLVFLKRLKAEGKETFIITNSPYDFVDKGMVYLVGEDWHDYFDVVIARAKKPDFFVDKMRPFREFATEVHMTCWGPVKALEQGKVYLEGNLMSLQDMKNWKGKEVLYFGDHPYSDLADVSLHHLWRTGAIIWELDNEITILNSVEYKSTTGWLLILQGLIENCQDTEHDESHQVIQEWIRERDDLRRTLKERFNLHFGSLFRTHDNPTYFSRRLFRFADIYTSRLTNLTNYSLKHTFYPRKGVLPHEYKSLFV